MHLNTINWKIATAGFAFVCLNLSLMLDVFPFQYHVVATKKTYMPAWTSMTTYWYLHEQTQHETTCKLIFSFTFFFGKFHQNAYMSIECQCHRMNGHPWFSWKWHLLHSLIPKLSTFWTSTWWTGGHFGFDLSRTSEVKSNFPPHLKTNRMVCTNYARNFTL